jgi:hypothetical protein
MAIGIALIPGFSGISATDAYIALLAAIFNDMRLQFIIGLLLGHICSYSQTFNVKGRVMECYNDIYDKDDKDSTYTLSLIDYYNKQTEKVKTDSFGNFEFKSVGKGKWSISVSEGVTEFMYHTPDTLINLNGDISNLIICTDKLFRPIAKINEDNMRLKAKQDIELGQMKLYKFTPWDILTEKDPLTKTNRKVKKYGLKVILVSCFRFSNRAEIEDYLTYKIYNEEIASHLDKMYGAGWRTKAKYNETD